MPELPEVERGRRLAESIARGRTIAGVSCARDEIVFDAVSPRTFQRALKGRVVRTCRRKGKQLWFELDGRGPHPLFHFGMAGAFHAPNVAPLQLASSGNVHETDWPPRFVKIHLHFDDGGELVMTDKRRFGRIRLRNEPEREPPISELGFDPLLEMPGPAAFAARLTARKAPIKAVLLDQKFAAGVGNWIADEVLYQARIDPRRRANTLDPVEAKRVRAALKRIIEAACRVNAEKRKFPKSWLFHQRWGKNAEARTVKGEKIEHLTVAGRTTAWIPAVQG